jgi:hypothetical protein
MMGHRWSAVALGAILSAVAVAVPAIGAGTAQDLEPSWAKINICDSSQLGVRAQLAGDGSTDQMQVRFSAQWLSPDGWVPLAGQASSPWLDAGTAEFTWQQAGWTFALSVPETGETYQLRAMTEMKLGSGQHAVMTTNSCTVGG